MTEATLGVLMLAGKMADIPGCMASAETFPYPVRRLVVTGSSTPYNQDDAEAMLPLYVTAAQQLEHEGVRVITANCGLMALVQDRVAAAVRVPVVLSSLVAVPTVARMIAPGRRIAVLTFFANAVDERNFAACGWSSADYPVTVVGIGEYESWLEFLRTKEIGPQLRARLRDDLRTVLTDLLAREPEIGAIVTECTMIPAVLDDLRAELPVPVFDILTVLDWTVSGFHRPVREAERSLSREVAAHA